MTANKARALGFSASHIQLFGVKRVLQTLTKCNRGADCPLHQSSSHEVCSQNTHTHLETLCLMKFAVWLPISYLVNSCLTICSDSNLWNAEGWERKWECESDTWCKIFQSSENMIALTHRRACSGNLHSPRRLPSSLYSPQRNPVRPSENDTDSLRTWSEHL